MDKRLFKAAFILAIGLIFSAPLSARAGIEELGSLDLSFSSKVTAQFGVSDEAVVGEAEDPSTGFGARVSCDAGDDAKLSLGFKTDMGMNMLEGTKPNHQLGVKFTASF